MLIARFAIVNCERDRRTQHNSVVSSLDNVNGLVAGDTRVLAAIYGPRAPWSAKQEDPERSLLDVTVLPVTGLPGPAEVELEETLRQIFEHIIVVTVNPRTVVGISVHIQADDGSACATAVNSVSLALLDAGVPMRTLPGAVSVGLRRVPSQDAESDAGGGAAPSSAASSATPGATEQVLDLMRIEEGPAALAASNSGGVGGRPAAGGAGIRTSLTSGSITLSSTASKSTTAAQDAASIVSVRSTLVFSQADIGSAGNGPLYCSSFGSCSFSELQALLATGKAAAATVIAFLRLAAKKKVLKDAVNFEGSISCSAAELEAAAFGTAPTASAAPAATSADSSDAMAE